MAPLISDNPENGKKIFMQRCAMCHSIEKDEEPKKIGPNLYGVWGRYSGLTDHEFTYSEALKNKQVAWIEKDLNEFLENPRKMVPGTKMIVDGLKRDTERADVVAYLKQACTIPKKK